MIPGEHRRGSDVIIGRWCDNGVHRCFHLRCTYLYRPQLRIANSLYLSSSMNRHQLRNVG